MRAKSVMLLMLALGCGLVASIGITQVMAKRNSGSGKAGETQAIFVALEDIPMGDLVTAESIKLEEWPMDKVPEGAMTNLEQIEGRRPKAKVWAGTVILDHQLFAPGVSAGGAAPQIPIGYRVVSVRVDAESGISNLIRPGDRVDVLLYVKRNPGMATTTSTRTIFQDLKVFAVNDVFDLGQTEGKETFVAKTVSLLVTPVQMEKFTLAAELGQIRLALRSHEDKSHVDLTGAFPEDMDEEGEKSDRAAEELSPDRPDDMTTLLGLLEGGGAQAGGQEPQRDLWTMRVIRGAKVAEVILETEPAPSAESAPDEGSWRMISPLPGASPDAAVDRDAEGPAADAEKKDENRAEEKPEPKKEDFDDG